MLVYRIEKLTKIYYPSKVVANDCINLEIKAGELLGIFGPNGAGKTTLVRQLMGLLRPTSGKIELFGYDIVKRPEIAPGM